LRLAEVGLGLARGLELAGLTRLTEVGLGLARGLELAGLLASQGREGLLAADSAVQQPEA